MAPKHSDLAVEATLSSLQGKVVDLVVTGSIASVESFRLIRFLRRLGARVRVFISPAGGIFITPAALQWASGEEVITEFHPSSTHLASADMCVVAPASASFLSRLKSGITDHAAVALCQSYLGTAAPVMLVPCMHDFLAQSPNIAHNLDQLSSQLTILSSRKEEGKEKFPDPECLAYDISHHYRRHQRHSAGEVLSSAVVLMGATRGYLDDVRYLSSYSSGEMGSMIAEELYSFGVATHVVVADAHILPKAATSFYRGERTSVMFEHAQRLLNEYSSHLVMPASILDFVPAHKQNGKFRSTSPWTIKLELQKKLRSVLQRPSIGEDRPWYKICFKLEPQPLSPPEMRALAERMFREDGVSMLVINVLADIQSSEGYRGTMITLSQSGEMVDVRECSSKREVAQAIRSYMLA